jgi:hypothetical protein
MPALNNQSACVVQGVPLISRKGENVYVVIIKGTYEFNAQHALMLSAEQEPILFVEEADEESSKGDVRIPSDLIDFKPATDVVILAPKAKLEETVFYGRRIEVIVGPVRVGGRVTNKWEFGPVRRDDRQRKRYAGTYDQSWIDNRMPLLPEDFDPRFNQVSPPARQVPGYLKGDERLKIVNVYGGSTDFESALPGRVPVVSGNVLSHYFTEIAVLDTVLIWSEKQRISLVWRHVIRPRQKIEEVCDVHVNLIRLRTARELYNKP